MQLTIKGKHLDVGDSLREHVHESLEHNAGKYFTDPLEATVTFTKEKGHRFHVDISIHVGHGILLQAENEADDAYVAFDGAAHRISKRLSRYKDKLRDHHRKEDPVDMHSASYTTFQSNENEASTESGSAVIAEMQTMIPTLAVSDAVMRLELGNLPALMFKNPGHGGYNMVYRRKDGNIGWVDPEGNQKKKPLVAAVKSVKTVAKAEAPKKTAKKAGRK